MGRDRYDKYFQTKILLHSDMFRAVGKLIMILGNTFESAQSYRDDDTEDALAAIGWGFEVWTKLVEMML